MLRGDILLLRPRGKRTHSKIFATEQLGLSYIAAVARQAGLSVTIIDGFLDPNRYEHALQSLSSDSFDLIGYPVYQETIHAVARDVARLRERGVTTHVTVGNHLATLGDERVLRQYDVIDSAIRGEGEYSIVALREALRSSAGLESVEGLTFRREGTIIRNPARANVDNLDTLPFPARDTLPLVLEAGNAPLVYSSRGCNARCDFCSVHEFFRHAHNGQWRGRSPSNVVDEIEYLHTEFGVTTIAFADEQFMGHGKAGTERALGIADELLHRGLDISWYIETRSSDVQPEVFGRLAEAGLVSVFMGVESGYDPALRAMRKGLSSSSHVRAVKTLLELEVLPTLGFIMFRPDSVLDEIRCNLDFLEQVACGELTAIATVLKVYAGTALDKRLAEEGVSWDQRTNHHLPFACEKVATFCSLVLANSDLLSTIYNSFAGLRRTGKLTFIELLSMQRYMNAAPIELLRRALSEIERGEWLPRHQVEFRDELTEICQSFLRAVRFAEVVGNRRDGFRLKNPMAHCA